MVLFNIFINISARISKKYKWSIQARTLHLKIINVINSLRIKLKIHDFSRKTLYSDKHGIVIKTDVNGKTNTSEVTKILLEVGEFVLFCLDYFLKMIRTKL